MNNDINVKLNIKSDTQEIVITSNIDRIQYLTPQQIAAVFESIAKGLRIQPEIPFVEMVPEGEIEL
jgi:hypothetical protein